MINKFVSRRACLTYGAWFRNCQVRDRWGISRISLSNLIIYKTRSNAAIPETSVSSRIQFWYKGKQWNVMVRLNEWSNGGLCVLLPSFRPPFRLDRQNSIESRSSRRFTMEFTIWVSEHRCRKTTVIHRFIHGARLRLCHPGLPSMAKSVDAQLVYNLGDHLSLTNEVVFDKFYALLLFSVFLKQRLMFKAYFQETVQERWQSAFQIRAVTISFFLEDGTIKIAEPAIDNSGLEQGLTIIPF